MTGLPTPRARAGTDDSRAFDTEEALRIIRRRTSLVPRTALVLGSGLGPVVDGIAWDAAFPTTDIPGLPRSTVAGHAGRLLIGRWSGRPIVAAQGRSHLYEGLTAEEVTRMVRLFAALGAKALVLTNASGGIAPRMTPGSLMLVEDQVNLQWRSPLRVSFEGAAADAAGRTAALPPLPEGPRGLSARPAYSDELMAKAARAAANAGVRMERGILGVMLGPSYETPAEIVLLERMGADAVCMSTGAEAAMAAALGLPTIAISCVTNWATGKSGARLSHADVTSSVAGTAPLLKSVLERLVLSLT